MANSYDYIVVGAGLTGLCIASRISQECENVLLIDSSDQIGGLNRPIRLSNQETDNGLRFVPDTPAAESALLFLESLLQLKLMGSKRVQAPLHFVEGQEKEFLGFGDTPPAYYENIAYFLAGRSIELNLPVHIWPQLLANKFKGEVLLKSTLTNILTNEQDGSKLVHQIKINGQKLIECKNLIFAGSPKSLLNCLAPHDISPKNRQKISKSKLWTGVQLDIASSSEISTNNAIYTLEGSAADEGIVFVGRFEPHNPLENVQISKWIGFIDHESSEDLEQFGSVIKRMKKVIKRSFPKIFESSLGERIVISPFMGGHLDLKLNGNQSLPELQNLWISSPLLSLQPNLVGGLQQAQLVLSGLGFGVNVTSKNDELFPCDNTRPMLSQDRQ